MDLDLGRLAQQTAGQLHPSTPSMPSVSTTMSSSSSATRSLLKDSNRMPWANPVKVNLVRSVLLQGHLHAPPLPPVFPPTPRRLRQEEDRILLETHDPASKWEERRAALGALADRIVASEFGGQSFSVRTWAKVLAIQLCSPHPQVCLQAIGVVDSVAKCRGGDEALSFAREVVVPVAALASSLSVANNTVVDAAFVCLETMFVHCPALEVEILIAHDSRNHAFRRVVSQLINRLVERGVDGGRDHSLAGGIAKLFWDADPETRTIARRATAMLCGRRLDLVKKIVFAPEHHDASSDESAAVRQFLLEFPLEGKAIFGERAMTMLAPNPSGTVPTPLSKEDDEKRRESLAEWKMGRLELRDAQRRQRLHDEEVVDALREREMLFMSPALKMEIESAKKARNVNTVNTETVVETSPLGKALLQRKYEMAAERRARRERTSIVFSDEIETHQQVAEVDCDSPLDDALLRRKMDHRRMLLPSLDDAAPPTPALVGGMDDNTEQQFRQWLAEVTSPKHQLTTVQWVEHEMAPPPRQRQGQLFASVLVLGTAIAIICYCGFLLAQHCVRMSQMDLLGETKEWFDNELEHEKVKNAAAASTSFFSSLRNEVIPLLAAPVVETPSPVKPNVVVVLQVPPPSLLEGLLGNGDEIAQSSSSLLDVFNPSVMVTVSCVGFTMITAIIAFLMYSRNKQEQIVKHDVPSPHPVEEMPTEEQAVMPVVMEEPTITAPSVLQSGLFHAVEVAENQPPKSVLRSRRNNIANVQRVGFVEVVTPAIPSRKATLTASKKSVAPKPIPSSAFKTPSRTPASRRDTVKATTGTR